MKITMPITITAADSESRTISGRIVTFDEVANTSAGRTVFAAGSIQPKNVKLNLEHDRTRPIGKTLGMSMSEDGKGIDATFKIAKTTAGNDALEEAMSGLRDGFSVGVAVDSYDSKDGAMIVTGSELIEVSLVTEPAVRSARVTDVAASEEKKDSEDQASSDVTPSQSQGEQVEENTVQETPTVSETVEASLQVQASSRPVAYTKPRIEFTPTKYLENSIRAALGDDEARQYVSAAADTTDNAGLVPTRQLSTIINGLSNTIRPSIDAISRAALPDAGMTFEIPKITQVPTVAATSEGSSPSEQDQNASFLSVSVSKYAGQQTFSVELLDRTSPAFFQELMVTLAAAYAKATNAAVNAALISGATLDSTTVATYPTASELLGIVARGASSVYSNTQGFARNMVVSSGQWSNIMTLNDSGRPIYNASNPMNAGGAVSPLSLRGNVAGLDLFVDFTNAGDGDGTIVIVNPDAYTWYESPTYQLRTDLISTGQVSIAMYGYGAIATKIGAGAFKNNKA